MPGPALARPEPVQTPRPLWPQAAFDRELGGQRRRRRPSRQHSSCKLERATGAAGTTVLAIGALAVVGAGTTKEQGAAV